MSATVPATIISITAKSTAATAISFLTKSSIASACLDPAAAHRDKLAELTSLGVTQFNLYLMNGGEEHQLDDYAREVLPRLHH